MTDSTDANDIEATEALVEKFQDTMGRIKHELGRVIDALAAVLPR